MSLKFKPNSRHIFLLSTGKYHNYSIPNFLTSSFELLKSTQISLDYTFENRNTTIKAAAYFKSEAGAQSILFTPRQIDAYGIEFFIEQPFGKYWTTTLSNTFIEQRQIINEVTYPGNSDFNYLTNITLRYTNPSIITISLNYITRPGRYYTPIQGGSLRPHSNFYAPNWSDDLYSQQYNNYHGLNLQLSRYIPFKQGSLVIYGSVNNLFNDKNQQRIQYNQNYSQSHFDYYQQRNFFFGVVYQLY